LAAQARLELLQNPSYFLPEAHPAKVAQPQLIPLLQQALLPRWMGRRPARELLFQGPMFQGKALVQIGSEVVVVRPLAGVPALAVVVARVEVAEQRPLQPGTQALQPPSWAFAAWLEPALSQDPLEQPFEQQSWPWLRHSC
jgi:hypothetical protein